MKLFTILPILLLSGCGLFPTRPVVVDHNVMVTVPCKIKKPEKPVMPLTDTGDIKDDIFVKSKKALSEIELRKGYELQLEAAVDSCK